VAARERDQNASVSPFGIVAGEATMAHSCKQLTDTGVTLFKELLEVFGDAFDEPGTYQGRVPSDAYLQALLRKSHVIALVAQEGNAVVGGLVAYVLEKFERERSEIYIYDLAVAERHRRKGVATQLIQTLKHIGKERGAYVMFVQADRGDEPAIRLYESLGKKEDVHHFDITVD
jgi:aminoglycoside 3-N-acetyltransferase I